MKASPLQVQQAQLAQPLLMGQVLQPLEHPGVVPLISPHFFGCITEPPNCMQYSKWGLKSSQYREMITPLTYRPCSCCNSPGCCLPLLPGTP